MGRGDAPQPPGHSHASIASWNTMCTERHVCACGPCAHTFRRACTPTPPEGMPPLPPPRGSLAGAFPPTLTHACALVAAVHRQVKGHSGAVWQFVVVNRGNEDGEEQEPSTFIEHADDCSALNKARAPALKHLMKVRASTHPSSWALCRQGTHGTWGASWCWGRQCSVRTCTPS